MALFLACKSINKEPTSSNISSSSGVDIYTTFPNAIRTMNTGESEIVLHSGQWPMPRKAVMVVSSCKYLEVEERNRLAIQLPTSGPSANKALLTNYSKLWQNLIVIQQKISDFYTSSGLGDRLGSLTVCIDDRLPVGRAYYYQHRIAIHGPTVGEDQLLHEVGHLIMSQMINDEAIRQIKAQGGSMEDRGAPCSVHSPSMRITPPCAYLEGWAHYTAMVFKNSPVIHNEDFSAVSSTFPVDSNEKLTARLFWKVGNRIGFPHLLRAMRGEIDTTGCYPKTPSELIAMALSNAPTVRIRQEIERASTEAGLGELRFNKCAAFN